MLDGCCWTKSDPVEIVPKRGKGEREKEEGERGRGRKEENIVEGDQGKESRREREGGGGRGEVGERKQEGEGDEEQVNTWQSVIHIFYIACNVIDGLIMK